MILGIDTSCYTTSVAIVKDGNIIADERMPLTVEKGERGLRQSDGVFMHIKSLPVLLEKLGQSHPLKDISAVAVSASPRPEENSYMPVFMAGLTVASSVATALNVPLYKTSHQEGHIMAALESCGEKVEDTEFISVHISGGTTELLHTKRTKEGFCFSLAGESLDLHAGQLIDRIGVAMGLGFPCGKELDTLALKSKNPISFPVTMKGSNFHLSGAEAQGLQKISLGEKKEDIAKGILLAVGKSLKKALDEINREASFNIVIMGGGVSASKTIRDYFHSVKCDYKVLFSNPAYSTDNACGVALIGDKLR
ncbi:MAG: O-sialoglycoprotein endopeptidase [Clostridia bacterium]|nr:O-sialoglycoprotein endopeptidase [Clostridia bacterium]